MKQMPYGMARDLMLPGDAIAFNGTGLASSIIKGYTKSNVSHIGTILQVKISNTTIKRINLIIESTSIGDGFAGVQINQMSTRVKAYKGGMWWLPLSKSARALFDEDKFFTWMRAQEGKPYDLVQALGSAIDFLPDQKEDFDKLFCSELYAEGMERAGVIGPINASEMTPIDDCLLPIFDETKQLTGEPKELM
jgi:hypothetical protein